MLLPSPQKWHGGVRMFLPQYYYALLYGNKATVEIFTNVHHHEELLQSCNNNNIDTGKRFPLCERARVMNTEHTTRIPRPRTHTVIILLYYRESGLWRAESRKLFNEKCYVSNRDGTYIVVLIIYMQCMHDDLQGGLLRIIIYTLKTSRFAGSSDQTSRPQQ